MDLKLSNWQIIKLANYGTLQYESHAESMASTQQQREGQV